jgi:hypothetical protein
VKAQVRRPHDAVQADVQHERVRLGRDAGPAQLLFRLEEVDSVADALWSRRQLVKMFLAHVSFSLVLYRIRKDYTQRGSCQSFKFCLLHE